MTIRAAGGAAGPEGQLAPSRSSFLRNTVSQYGLQVAKYVFPLVTLPYLTRVLGPEAYAVRAYVLAAMSFAQVLLDFGFNAYGTRGIAQAGEDSAAKSALSSAVVALRLAMAAVGVPVVAAAALAIPLLRANPAYVALAYLTVCLKAALPDFVFQGEQDMGIITRRFVGSQAVGTALILLFVHGPDDLLLVPAFEAIAALVGLAWSWADVLGPRGYRLSWPGVHALREALSRSAVFFLSSAATTIFTSLTTLMIGALVDDAAQVSYWSVAMTAVGAIQSLYTPITNSLYPHMVVERDFALVRRLLLIGMPVVCAGTAAFALLRDTVMLVLGGPEYLAGSYVVGLVSPVLLFSFPGMLLGFPVLAAVGRDRELTASSVASAAFHVAGLLLLVALGLFDIPCVAVLRDLTEAMMLVLRAWFVWRWRREAGADAV